MNSVQIRALVVMLITEFFGTLGYLAILPSLVFYVKDLGGTTDQYGLILSATSFFSFCFMSVFAHWVDSNGNKYRVPFLAISTLQVAGNLMYFLAICFPSPYRIYAALAARCIYGIGVGGTGGIAFAYIASIVDPDDLTLATNYFGLAQFGGLALGPFLNVLIGEIDTEFYGIPFNSHNTVGLVLGALDFSSLLLVYFFVPEPTEIRNEEGEEKQKQIQDKPQEVHKEVDDVDNDDDEDEKGWIDALKSLRSIQLWLPIAFLIFPLSGYNIIEAALSPATKHALDWGPVEISAALGGCGVFLAAATVCSMIMSNTYKVQDLNMVIIGACFCMIGSILVYYLWTDTALVWHYILPILCFFTGFPFIGAPARSLFTIAIALKPELKPIEVRLQALFAMVVEVANFSAPLIVTTFLLHTPNEIEGNLKQTGNNHELTRLTLLVPVLLVFCIIGALYLKSIPVEVDKEKIDTNAEDEQASESTALLVKVSTETKSKKRRSSQTLSTGNKAIRRRSSAISGPGMFHYNTAGEKKMHD